MVSWVGVHSPNTGWTWPSTSPGITALPPASSTASVLVSVGGSRAAILVPSISSDFTAAWGFAMSPVKNSPMLLMSSVDTGRPDANALDQCLCTVEDFSKAAFCSFEASFWCLAFHCSNGSP